MENLDRQVELLVFGKEMGPNYRGSPYTQDATGAQKVVQAMLDKGYDFELDHDEEGWQARFYRIERGFSFTQYFGENMNEAICNAAVNAIKNELEPSEKIVASGIQIGKLYQWNVVHDEYIGYFPDEIEEDEKVSSECISQVIKEITEHTEAAREQMIEAHWGTAHGRWSSTTPNPQTLPRDTELNLEKIQYNNGNNYVPKHFDVKIPLSFDYGAIEQKVTGMRTPIPPLGAVPAVITTHSFPCIAASSSGKSFNPQEELPNPRPGDLHQGTDGTLWYAVDNNTWVEYEADNHNNAIPTGRMIDVRNRGLTTQKDEAKTVQNSIVKPTTYESCYHKWKTYESLISKDYNFDYCEVCGSKKTK